MLKTLIAHTYEVDDPKIAVEEIQQQLRLEEQLLKNSIGIIHFPPDYVDTNVAAEVSKSMPFPTVGCTTGGNMIRNKIGDLILTVTVLTSDDVNFSVGLTGPLTGNKQQLADAYQTAAAALPEKPVMVLAFFPNCTIDTGLGGDFIVSKMSCIAENVPMFGTLAEGLKPDISDARIICNGSVYFDRFAFVLVQGAVKPRFYLGSIPSNRVLEKEAIVTASHDCYVEQLNGVPILDYIGDTLGIKTDNPTALQMVPLVCDFHDGAPPVLRLITAFTSKGAGVSTGLLPVGTSLFVSEIGSQDVIQSTTETLQRILQIDKEIHGLLMYSCAARLYALEFVSMQDHFHEMRTVDELLAEREIPFSLHYSGGELCPVSDQSGKLVNRYHNYTFVVCVW